jgi:hypothetical protein
MQFNHFWDNNHPASVNIKKFADMEIISKECQTLFSHHCTTIPVQNKSGPTVLQLMSYFYNNTTFTSCDSLCITYLLLRKQRN